MKISILLSMLITSVALADEQVRSCRILDETGAVIATHESAKCQTELREKVKLEKCSPGQKLVYTFIGQGSSGKDLKPITMNIICPRR